MQSRAIAIALTPLLLAAVAASAEELRNWFDDPFVQLSAEAQDCPMPAGPFTSEKDRLVQSHRRAEKGTTAWLAGESDRPKAYAYDAEIAAALVKAFRGSELLTGSSLWATVQGRVVYIEGCLAPSTEASQVESLVRSVPNVQQAIAIVRIRVGEPVPYRPMPPAASSPLR